MKSTDEISYYCDDLADDLLDDFIAAVENSGQDEDGNIYWRNPETGEYEKAAFE